MDVCVCVSLEAEQVMCVCMRSELDAEGGGGNIKQRFCVLSSNCLDRTPPRPNEVFVCISPSYSHARTYTHSAIHLAFGSSIETFFLKEL